MKKHRQLLSYSVLAFGMLLFILFTSPNKIPAVLLVVPFVAFFFLLRGLLLVFERGLLRLSTKNRLSTDRILLFPTIGSLTLTIMLVLGSLGELTTRDIILVILFGLLVLFYISKTRRTPHQDK